MPNTQSNFSPSSFFLMDELQTKSICINLCCRYVKMFLKFYRSSEAKRLRNTGLNNALFNFRIQSMCSAVQPKFKVFKSKINSTHLFYAQIAKYFVAFHSKICVTSYPTFVQNHFRNNVLGHFKIEN